MRTAKAATRFSAGMDCQSVASMTTAPGAAASLAAAVTSSRLETRNSVPTCAQKTPASGSHVPVRGKLSAHRVAESHVRSFHM